MNFGSLSEAIPIGTNIIIGVHFNFPSSFILSKFSTQGSSCYFFVILLGLSDVCKTMDEICIHFCYRFGIYLFQSVIPSLGDEDKLFICTMDSIEANADSSENQGIVV